MKNDPEEVHFYFRNGKICQNAVYTDGEFVGPVGIYTQIGTCATCSFGCGLLARMDSLIFRLSHASRTHRLNGIIRIVGGFPFA